MPWKVRAVLGVVLALLTAAVIGAQMKPGSGQAPSEQPAPAAGQPSTTAPGAPAVAAAEPPPKNGAIEELQKQIAGHEKEPAGKVFKNVQILKDVPAENLLKIMQFGFSPALGVKCGFCHEPRQWEKDDKKEKKVTREMMKMTTAINADYIKKMKDLPSDDPSVNCTTCHRGQKSPVLRM
ncbi:MAG TPA: c-type cytochrome [Thermoanaerobaculia bacterium]|nr:c-type cytochrome [Thermoanaerobaculia bacterium]